MMDKLIAINTTNLEIAGRIARECGTTFEVFGITKFVFSHSTLSLEIRKMLLLGELPKPKGTELSSPYDYTRYLEAMKSSSTVGSSRYEDITTQLKLLLENIQLRLGAAEDKWLETINVVNKLYMLFPGISIPNFRANKHYRCIPKPTQGSLKLDKLSFEVDGTDVCRTKLVEIVGDIYSIDTEIPGWSNGSTLLKLDQTFAGPKVQRHISNGSTQGSFSVDFRGMGYNAHAIGLNIPQNHMAEGYMLCPLIKSVTCRGSAVEIEDFNVGERPFFDFIVSETEHTVSIYNHVTKALIYQFENCYDLDLMYPEFVWELDDDSVAEIYDDDDFPLGTARFV